MDSKKNLRLLLIIISLGVIIIAGSYLQGLNNKPLNTDQDLQEDLSDKVVYIINKGDGAPITYKIADVSSDDTVFSLLEELAEENNFTITKTDYPSMGVLVNSIAGLNGGTDSKWWQYWINGALGDVAADRKPVQKGDRILWKFEVISF
ncbi:MAG: DUF4430 domain-containing protein [Candidatus Parcubacteria bacterium]|nr:DUF4430 domain-containing protein [Candidatus Parcubacteria bacterium]